MRGIIGIVVVAGLACGAMQEQPARTNTLTPKEAAEGWLLLFDGETPFGWKGNATAKDGSLCLDGAGTLQTTTAFCEYALEFKCRIIGAQMHDDIQLGFAGKMVKMAFPKDKNSTSWKHAKLLVAGKRYKFTGDFPIADGEVSELTPNPITFKVADGAKLELRDVMLTPLGAKSLFNGKNLDGWKEFAGKKYLSKFTVNDKLELNVKNGPGDLQTVGQYADFCLQLDCCSNGQYLNSGIFCRCKPNEYQNGYETQIHNKFLDKPKTYVVEVFDPITHKLLDKKKMQNTAADFGTGAIYRRIPARKEVAKDGEWFTMTIVAHGNHFATWVNGQQVVDWDDHRPPNDNPRNGCRLEAGHISIQGHDPTTDLNFRNLRIAVYPQ